MSSYILTLPGGGIAGRTGRPSGSWSCGRTSPSQRSRLRSKSFSPSQRSCGAGRGRGVLSSASATTPRPRTSNRPETCSYVISYAACAKHVVLVAHHIPGTTNVAADVLYRNPLFSLAHPRRKPSSIPPGLCQQLGNCWPAWTSQDWTGSFSNTL